MTTLPGESRLRFRKLATVSAAANPSACSAVTCFRCGARTLRPEEVEFFLRLHGLWEPIIDIPPPPEPPFDIETMKPMPPASAHRYRATEWRAPERALDEERILLFDAEEPPFER